MIYPVNTDVGKAQENNGLAIFVHNSCGFPAFGDSDGIWLVWGPATNRLKITEKAGKARKHSYSVDFHQKIGKARKTT